MNLKEFERRVLAGEITDFEPYFTKHMTKTKENNAMFSPKTASKQTVLP